jgi:phosphoribosylaminoimidazole (AIR) synthetase
MTYVAERGHVSIEECFRVFNMGVGFVLVSRPTRAARLLETIEGSLLIGEIVPATSEERVRLSGA